MPDAFSAIERSLREAVEAHVFPAVSVEIGHRAGARWAAAAGAHTFDPYATLATPDTTFDLASLTKVIATATLAMRAKDDGRLRLEDRVAAWLPDWRGTDRETVTIRDLLAHSSGLPAYLPFFRDCTGRQEFQRALCTLPLEYIPRAQSIYSDLGFILLGFILEDAASVSSGFSGVVGTYDPSSSIAVQFQRVSSFVTAEPLTFNPPRAWRSHTAPTEVDPWRGRLLTGEVHDENAWALGGVAAHAGLFGTAAAVGAFARAVMRTLAGEPILARPETMREFIQRSEVQSSSRALGWDTMQPTSSCGTRLSPSAVGHTGFTGTSLWIDPARKLFVILLTNRIHPSVEKTRTLIQPLRREAHAAVVEALAEP
jgi:CubicO group peptidase (beta-lactamase class C family)